ncbi:MAG TPA: DNA-binding protein [Rhodospirillales bacterium]|nr:DNA-binding protein [Rhodospirillales bacterium]
MEFPLTLPQAARLLSCSERWLRGFLRQHRLPHCRAGRRILFFEPDWRALEEALRWHSDCGAESAAGHGTSEVPSAVSVSTRLRARLTGRSPGRSSRRASASSSSGRCTVIALSAPSPMRR